eukprot:CAMPEP_0183335340 /NCGR_PEP_ID=MMETSP0164_2-20130417/3677_1 /TAXON_ID=221442 /ORGANISM="Coccolithus pelagicus ssp braarudi, Strain PLY182g" /LENGTH=74 /DNA_ID=CAMNT_0025504689 /DNA_START=218 /DNA_END=439 /DNA_ORIENTATION=-
MSLYEGAGQRAVAKEYASHEARGWISRHSFIHTFPIRCEPAGAAPKPDGGARGLVNSSAPHIDSGGNRLHTSGE